MVPPILLGLKGQKVWRVSENEGEIMIEVRREVGEASCPHCNLMRLYRHGLGQRKVLHSWSGDKKVYLELHYHRWRRREYSCSLNGGAELLRSYSWITRQAEDIYERSRSGALVVTSNHSPQD